MSVYVVSLWCDGILLLWNSNIILFYCYCVIFCVSLLSNGVSVLWDGNSLVFYGDSLLFCDVSLLWHTERMRIFSPLEVTTLLRCVIPIVLDESNTPFKKRQKLAPRYWRILRSLYVIYNLKQLLLSNTLLGVIIGGPLQGKVFEPIPYIIFFLWQSKLPPICPSCTIFLSIRIIVYNLIIIVNIAKILPLWRYITNKHSYDS